MEVTQILFCKHSLWLFFDHGSVITSLHFSIDLFKKMKLRVDAEVLRFL
jgi:hypothetical protein